MWTRLLYLTYTQATKRGKQYPIKNWEAPYLSNRYRGLLAKEFRRLGLPVYWKNKRFDLSRKHDHPKTQKLKLAKKLEREMKIKQLLEKADDEIDKYRQTWVNNRKNKGFEMVLDQIIPDWIESAKNMEKDHKVGGRNKDEQDLSSMKKEKNKEDAVDLFEEGEEGDEQYEEYDSEEDYQEEFASEIKN